MAWRFHSRIKVSPTQPQAAGICDSCGFGYPLADLTDQLEWRGDSLQKTGFKVCTVTCLDVPFIFNRPLRLPPDPLPVFEPRAPVGGGDGVTQSYYAEQMNSYRVVQEGGLRITEDNLPRGPEPTGDDMLRDIIQDGD